MNLLLILKRMPKEVNILTGVSIGILLIKILWLDGVDSPFAWMQGIGGVFQDVLVSIIASYIFFFFVVQLKDYSNKKTVSPYIAKHTKMVVGECISQLGDITQSSGVELKLDTLTQERLTSAFLKINPTSRAPLVFFLPDGYANWLQYFQFHNSRSRGSINRVLGQLIFLEAKHVSLLVAIDDCLHFQMMHQMQNHKINNTDMSAFASTFFEYCEFCRNLNTYINKSMVH